MVSSILDKQLILIAGKGGVGRSTAAAAIAAACARRGRKTLLYQASAQDRFGEFFGTSSVGTEISKLRENLFALNTNPIAALEEYGMMILRFRRVYRMVFENRVSKYFLRAIPGLDDYAVLGKAWFHSKEKESGRPRFDTIVFDLPASGHSLSMLKLPWVITETVPEGPLTRDARAIQDLLTDPTRTGVVLVTLAEEMPANEAAELSASFEKDLTLEIDHLIINQVYPDRFPPGSPARRVVEELSQSPPTDPELHALSAHAELIMRRRDLNRSYLDRLVQLDAPSVELPMLFTRHVRETEIDHLSALLERHLDS